ncbi:MAG TPA: aminoacyl-tRNA hydrolase [Anaerovoracaceae bacterium]|nr:aminoacyl-tRNA hydrolase [Anaerovoracaceae bacterium]
MEEHNPHDDPEKAKARKDQEDPWVMYLIVRESLGMGAGKIGAQCGHAVGMMYEKLHGLKKQEKNQSVLDKLNTFEAWRNESYRKVVLRADDKEWEKLKAELECFVVRDAGFTEVPAGSETVIGLWPMRKSQVPKIVKKLQVLK